MRKTTRARSAALAAVAVLALAGCAAGDAATAEGVATLEDGAAPANGDAAAADHDGADESDGSDGSQEVGQVEAPEDPELAFGLYDECLSDAGFDVGATLIDGSGDGDGNGAVSIDELELEEADPQTGGVDADFGEDFAAAEAECAKHLEALDLSFDLSPEEEAALEDAQLAWAECMEEQGIEVPELDVSGSANVQVFGDPVDPDDPQADSDFDDADFDVEAFEEANEACEHIFDEVLESTGLATEEGS